MSACTPADPAAAGAGANRAAITGAGITGAGVSASAGSGGTVAVLALVVATVVVGVAAPQWLLSMLIPALLLALQGQAWNLMMGYAGQLSLGHALYGGLAAYVTGLLFARYGLSPWLTLPLAIAAAAAAGAVIGFLGFRFGVRGVYFALLTIASAEFVRILFEHLSIPGVDRGQGQLANGVLYLPVTTVEGADVWHLRGTNTLFFFVAAGFVGLSLVLSWFLLSRRIGYQWRAIREDQEAAAALGIDLFWTKMKAVVLSAAMAAPAGMIYAFYNNNLFPEIVFRLHTSIEIVLVVIVGGIGTLFGPLVGALVLAVAGEALTLLADELAIQGLKQLGYGLILGAVVILRPDGLWPWLRRLALGAGPQAEEEGRGRG